MQFPWPLLVGAVAGLALAVGAGLLSSRRTGAPVSAVTFVATALAGASAGAFLAMAWFWTVPMSRPVACLYSCVELQFLSNEQFRQLMIMRNLAWILPVATLVFGALAARSGRRAP